MTDSQFKYWELNEKQRHNTVEEMLGKMQVGVAQAKLPYETAKLKEEARLAQRQQSKTDVDTASGFMKTAGQIIDTAATLGQIALLFI